MPLHGKPGLDIPGGNLYYSAAGMGLWQAKAGLVARVSEDYPIEWLEPLEQLGFDLAGIKQAGFFDMKYYIAHLDEETFHLENPINDFITRRLTFPQELLGYQPVPDWKLASKDYLPFSIHITDVPEAYKQVRAAHICPVDLITHRTLPVILRAGSVQTISLSSSCGYMDPVFWKEVISLLGEVTIFHTTEREIRKLFQGRSVDLWEMTDQLASFGPEYILIKLKTGQGFLLWDSLGKRKVKIPEYPVKIANLIGAWDAFAGAFLVGYKKEYDSLKAATMGAVMASFAYEGLGPLYALQALPELVNARFINLQQKIQLI